MTSPNRGLPAVWLKGCNTQEEKKKREELVRNNIAFASLFLSILQDRYETIERKGMKEEDYSSKDWVFLQAFRNGKLAELTELADLFSYLRKE
jgi:hypothetical protein